MGEKTSECRAGTLPVKEGLPMVPAYLLHALEWILILLHLHRQLLEVVRTREPLLNPEIFRPGRIHWPMCGFWRGLRALPGHKNSCSAILTVCREPFSTPGTAVCPASRALFLPGHEKRSSMGVPKSRSSCSFAIVVWVLELLGVEQIPGEQQGSLCNGQ